MFKAVKECMRNWVMTHKRLYWYIVVGIAVLAFGIITGMGCSKLEKAEAAEETLKVNWHGKEVYIPTGNYTYYLVVKDFSSYGDMVILSYDKMTIIKEGAYYNFGTYNSSGVLNTSGIQSVCYGTQNPSKDDIMSTAIYYYAFSTSKTLPNVSKVIANYDVLDAVTGNVVYESFIGYSSDAPYSLFRSLSIENEFSGLTSNLNNFNLYTDYIQNAMWTYSGKLVDTTPLDLSYQLNLRFVVELPPDGYIFDLYDVLGYNSNSVSSVLLHNKEVREYWYSDTSVNAREYIVEYSVPISLDENECFSYAFNFMQWEYLLRASDSALNAEFDSHTPHGKALLLLFMHVKQIRTEVVTTREDTVVYGGFTTNQFRRGVYTSCAEAYTAIDKGSMDSATLEGWINYDLSIAEQEYLKELEGRIEELENQLGGVTSAEGAFGDLEGSDLWTGFQSLVSGLASMGPSIGALSVLTGHVFGFLPSTITSIMYTTLLAICIIAIVKAIRG